MISSTTPDVHPDLDLPLLHDVLHPDRPLWTPTQLQELTSTVATELTTPLLGMLTFDPVRRWWARLALTEGVELWLLSWDRGEGTAPHDHGGASGAFSVLLGRVDEHYRYPGGPVRHKRHQVGRSIAFGPTRAHQIVNTGTRKAATVHAYSPPLLPVREYADLHTEVPQPGSPQPGLPQPRVSL